MSDQFEREEDRIMEALADGLLTNREAQRELTELRRDYEAMIEEEAQDAYDAVLGDYGIWR